MEQERDRRIGVVVVAAGRGERAGGTVDGPKQYRQIGGHAVLWHTIKAFLDWPHTGPIIVVIHPDDEDLYRLMAAQLPGSHDIAVTFGAPTRQLSVLQGLRSLAGKGVSHVLIQDGVRPFIDRALLDRVRDGFMTGHSALLPALPVTDTIKRFSSDGRVVTTVPRDDLCAAQTPQAFKYEAIFRAHEAAATSGLNGFTDDASIAEWAGIPVQVIEGSADNVKLTTRKDIAMADEKLGGSLPDVRTGNGYDVHQLIPGDGVTLCGIFIPHDQKLMGHSDADVALHALTDALLATCGAGDIGDHFPPSDPQWKGAPSRIFLEHAAKIIRQNGGTIMNVDVSLIAEAPKVGPHREAMRQKLSDILGISLERCSVKATTNEKIGFVGRREGIAAIATASVVFRRAS
ncbi:bifunctional 2-C-methyl-D-erythritol 4-phosphate cytidylyltransferase/2-C-methyl-D-erythritol 2,4-cyclodiphosphate synthase [Peteryoungia desertarenae]|uniref:Bifunctional enzyme IspD/IspF n=1 Tax=Peteryoungia desertarenae TaxID=1813451 RepID=A0ABX6QPP0_9HYPH|nr:bifunctional 2-C-methyl-D-erythritol 4-phosphate cytidylyltransferase/2-C-methyl-D-erythritol 2,4-cyclodiphosphate synthase [Peteryoungia desertarenae]QLF70407.1 bifunctional 2-C-methyl-D-erythritol 4-phosphate cytidylyltransferase/2-C-methyl-D-erythritol 2,4-cyclodiphosphate synthase [Peteryoungia desertarenae]